MRPVFGCVESFLEDCHIIQIYLRCTKKTAQNFLVNCGCVLLFCPKNLLLWPESEAVVLMKSKFFFPDIVENMNCNISKSKAKRKEKILL